MATTINKYSVGLTLDAGEYINKAALSATETRRLSRSIEQARSPAEKFSREQERLTKAYKSGAISNQTYNRLLDASRQKHLGAAMAAEKNAKATLTLSQRVMGARSSIDSFMRSNIVMIGVTASFGAGAVAATKFYNAVREAQLGLDEVAKKATGVGMTVRELQSLQFASGEITGIDGDQVVRAMRELQRRAAKAVEGDPAMARAFQKIGIDAGRAMSQGPLESLTQMADAFSEIESHGERINLAQEMFGRSGAEMVALLTAGRDTIEESVGFHQRFNNLTDAQILGVEAANDAWGRVHTATKGITNTIAVEMAPLVESMAKDMLGVTAEVESMTAFAQRAAEFFSTSYGFVKGIGGEATRFGEIASAFMRGGAVGAGAEAMELFRSGIRGGTDELIHLYSRRSELAKEAAEKEAKRDQERAASAGEMAEKEELVTTQYKQQIEALDQQVAMLVFGEQAAIRMQREAAGMTEEMIRQLETQEGIIARIEERVAKEKEAAAEAERSSLANKAAFEKSMEDELASIEKHFADQRKRDEMIRREISKSPESMEVGSAEAASFLADQVNAAIGAAAMPDRPTEGEDQLLHEAREQLKELREAKKLSAEQVTEMKAMVAELKENGFRRFR